MKIAVLILFCFSIQSCHKGTTSSYSGVYEMDLAHSKLGKYDTIRDLKLIINSNNTFEFSKDVPFIFNQKGTWELKHIIPLDMPPFDKCYFIYSENHRKDVLRPIDDRGLEISFDYPLPKYNQEQVELLYFKKKIR